MAVQIRVVSENWGLPEGRQRRLEPQLRLISSNLLARDVIAEKTRRDYQVYKSADKVPVSVPQSDLSSFLDKTEISPKDESEAVKLALESFTDGAFLFFWNENQVESLDESLINREVNEALFVKLFPLAGG
ncbi:hypothetical protein [Roseibium sp.]|uniref:hypothetical protein n=1 Tax=Roseibium sp. TaxID=1936156 RepID=UPI003D0CB927